MNNSKDHTLVRVVRDSAYVLSGVTKDYDQPLERTAVVAGEVEETFPSGV